MKVKLRLETAWASSVVLRRVQFRVRTMFTPTGRHERRNTMVARIQFWLNAKARAAENAERNRISPAHPSPLVSSLSLLTCPRQVLRD